MWRPGKAVVPHRHEEPASYRPTTTARKHGPLQSRTGRQIRDVDRGYTLLWSRLRRHCLILIDARFSSCSPRSSLRHLGVIKRVLGTYRYYLTRAGRAAIAAGRRLTEHTIIPALA